MSGRSKARPSTSRSASAGRLGSAHLPGPALVSLLLVACQPDLPEVTWTGKIIRFGATHPEDVCGDSLEWMDARAGHLAEALGPGTRSTIDFFWLSDVSPWCGHGSAGCGDGGQVKSTYVPHEHEIVHALRKDFLPAVFEEGLATMYGDIGWADAQGNIESRERLLEILETSDPVTNEDYARAGHFVSFLIERDGLEPLRELAELADYHDDIAEVRKAFEQAYGITLDQALEEYEDYPECIDLAWMSREIACREATTTIYPNIDAPVEFTMPVECGVEGTYGPMDRFIFSEAVLDIEPEYPGLPMNIRLTGDIDGGVSAAFVSCDGGCGEAIAYWIRHDTFQQPFLPAGRYVVRFYRLIDSPGEVGLEFSM